jgi:hypothetical protein
MKKATPLKRDRSPAQANHTTSTAPSKICRVLAILISGRSMNRFEAEREGEHCLHTTISALANKHDLLFVRTPETVPTNWGASCRVIRYRLAPSHIDRAEKLLVLLASRSAGRAAA